MQNPDVPVARDPLRALATDIEAEQTAGAHQEGRIGRPAMVTAAEGMVVDGRVIGIGEVVVKDPDAGLVEERRAPAVAGRRVPGAVVVVVGGAEGVVGSRGGGGGGV